MKLTSQFSYSKVDYSLPHSIHLLVTAEAPAMDIADRVPLNLIVAADVSGSMEGEKIEYVRKSLTKLIEHLTDKDRLGLLVFNYQAKALFEPMFMTPSNKSAALKHVSSLRAFGGTNVSHALHLGTELGRKLERYRFVFLTDGQPTSGESNKGALLTMAKGLCPEGVCLTTFGYGIDHDPEFLSSLASGNKGNYAFIKNPDDALAAFALELGGLLSCYGHDLKFKIVPKDGVTITKVVSDVDVEELNGSVMISVPDIYSEAKQNIVVAVDLTKQDTTLPRPVTLLDVSLTYTDTRSGEKKELTSKAKVSFVKAADADKQPDKDVMAEVQLALLMEAQTKAEAAAERGDFAFASMVLQDTQDDFLRGRDLDYKYRAVSSVASAFSYDQEKYAMKATKSAVRNSARGASAGGQSVGSMTSNSMQQTMVNAFVGSSTGTFDGSSIVLDNGGVHVVGGDINLNLSTQNDVVVQQTVTAQTTTLTKNRAGKGW